MTERRGWLARDLLPSVFVGLLIFHLIRTNFAERYRVTSRSMEPTLHGHPDDGDIVLVDRTAWRRAEPRCWDLVVVRNREEPGSNHLVKRLLAVGPGDLDFREGDLFFGYGNDLRRVRKHPVIHRDMRVTHRLFDPVAGLGAVEFLHADAERWSVEGGDAGSPDPVLIVRHSGATAVTLRSLLRAEPQEERSRAQDPYLPGHLSLQDEVDASFLDGNADYDASVGGPRPRDFGVELVLSSESAASNGGLQIVLEHAETYFAAEIDIASRGGRFTVMGQVEGEFSIPAAGRTDSPSLSPETVEFGYLDGRFFVVIDGELVFEKDILLPREARLLMPDSAFRKPNLAHVGAFGSDLRVRRLRIFRDPHYTWGLGGGIGGGGEPMRLEVDEIFVVGDNAYDSADSRERVSDPFQRADLVGRPMAILSPARRRWLDRYPEPVPK